MKINLATKYTLSISLLLILTIAMVLLGTAVIGVRNLDEFRVDLARAFTSAQTANSEQTLDANASYLAQRLFNPLFHLDISSLNAEIHRVKQWLPVTEFIIVDQQGRILTDGTEENARYGEIFPVPNELQQQSHQLIHHSRGVELNLTIGFRDGVQCESVSSLSNQA